MKKITACLIALTMCSAPYAQAQQPVPPPVWQGKFEQMGTMLPTPNEYRTASGAPGPRYWQQQADYDIAAELDDDKQKISARETITYYNNSPSALPYLWLQLDQNLYAPDNNTDKTKPNRLKDTMAVKDFAGELSLWERTGGYKILSVTDKSGNALPHTINKTMMRVDLPQPLRSGEKYALKIEWEFIVVDRSKEFARGGCEYFPEDKNYLYTVAQWFPRMCLFDDVQGWQNKQFLGNAEFALSFGNYKASLTVPADHIVAATGTLTNAQEVLTPQQWERYQRSQKTFDKPVVIVTEAEAREREKNRLATKKTWKFEATNVRDFAFAASRKFIWDAMAVKVGKNTPLAMSVYPKEGNPLWEKEGTLAVKNTLEIYSRHTVDYPYPQATAVHAASIGMEYPMICFNYGRPKKDGTYSPELRKGMIGVVIHEVGHNFFPMIINSDERQWTWIDEGFNSFLQMLTQFERYPKDEWARGKPASLVGYMAGDKSKMRPLMTNPEQVLQLGNEQYAKCVVGLYILRESVMGKELFDKAFKEYANRWAFKHPRPADFFRTMEDASATDLDWFWKGWFYTIDHVDQSLDKVTWYRMRDGAAEQPSANGNSLSSPSYFSLIPTDDRFYGEFLSRIDDKAMADKFKNKNFYEISVSNKGGMLMPVTIEWTFADGTKETDFMPAEIWRVNETRFAKVFVKDKQVTAARLDPQRLYTDIDASNDVYPR